ncbi:nose resistant to fluoxetine protein 6-like isoform X2 [Physella acuta]|nr:nose resistant to fluoxetine protein 6-like isoform X2 [Physella acuta]
MLTSVEIRTDHREITTATIVAICVFSAIGVLVIVGTMYDLIFIQIPKWKSQKVKRTEKTAEKNLSQEHSQSPVTLIAMTDTAEANGQRETTDKFAGNKNNSELKQREGTPASNGNCDVHTQSAGSNSVDKTKEGKKKLNACIMILLAFSVYTNGSKVLNTAQPPGSLSAINGIRFLSMSWVILGHTYFTATLEVGTVPMTAILDHLKDWTFDAIYNAGLAVDTFFTLSGLLVAYLTFKEIKKKGWKLNWPLFYFHRYWRLTPPYMLTMLMGQGFLAFMGSGATWSMKMPSDRENCEANWWTNLIYVNNVVHVDKMCMLHSWYLSNDMQFYVLSPLMIVPFYFHYAAGVVSCLVFLLAQMITSGVLSVDNNWTAVALFSGPAPKKDGLDWQTHYYFAPYGRIGPYIIGVMAGVLLATWKGKLRLHKAVVAVGWCVSTVSALAVLYGLHGDISGERYSTAPVSAFYNAVSRAVWGACISWIVLASASGYGGPVNKFLSWSAFVPLSRLTYMAYLIHPYIMVIYFGNLESAYHLMDSSLVVSFLGLLVVSNMAAFLLMLGMESPMIALEKVLFTRKR